MHPHPHAADASTVYIVGQSSLINCRAKNAGGVAIRNSVLFMRDSAKLTECRARQHGGGIMTFGECQISMTGQVTNMWLACVCVCVLTYETFYRRFFDAWRGRNVFASVCECMLFAHTTRVKKAMYKRI
jgi:hypothetical protein